MIAAVGLDEQLWRQAYRDHAGVVLAYLRRRVAARAEAEDLLQETFVRAMDSGTYRSGNLRGYLLTIARNLLISKIRRPRLVVSSSATDARPEIEPIASGSPEGAAAWSGFHERLEGVLGRMSPDQRSTFEMGVIEQRPYAEIARLTGTSLSTVKVRIFRARRKILAELGAELQQLRGVLS